MKDRQIETLYPVKKNNKMFILMIIVILLIVVICVIGIISIFDKKEEKPNDDNKVNTPIEEEEQFFYEEESLQKENYVYKKYSCLKDTDDITLDNGIKVKSKIRYEFNFNDGVSKTAPFGAYYVDYIFNNISEYNSTNQLPVVFSDDIPYSDEKDVSKLTKTRLYSYIIEYPDLDKDNYLNSYLEALEKDNFDCTLVEKEEVINNYDEYYETH